MGAPCYRFPQKCTHTHPPFFRFLFWSTIAISFFQANSTKTLQHTVPILWWLARCHICQYYAEQHAVLCANINQNSMLSVPKWSWMAYYHMFWYYPGWHIDICADSVLDITLVFVTIYAGQWQNIQSFCLMEKNIWWKVIIFFFYQHLSLAFKRAYELVKFVIAELHIQPNYNWLCKLWDCSTNNVPLIFILT